MSHLISSKIDTFECLHNERGRSNVVVVNVGVNQIQYSSSSIWAWPKSKRNSGLQLACGRSKGPLGFTMVGVALMHMSTCKCRK
jgi:hypothetical protein